MAAATALQCDRVQVFAFRCGIVNGARSQILSLIVELALDRGNSKTADRLIRIGLDHIEHVYGSKGFVLLNLDLEQKRIGSIRGKLDLKGSGPIVEPSHLIRATNDSHSECGPARSKRLHALRGGLFE